MNQYDICGMLMTYSQKCSNARSDEQLQEFIKELKAELTVKEIKKLRIEKL